MPQSTLDALLDHGVLRGDTITSRYPEAVSVLRALSDLHISLDQVTSELETDGVNKFAQAWKELQSNVESALK
jgi:transaldolase